MRYFPFKCSTCEAEGYVDVHKIFSDEDMNMISEIELESELHYITSSHWSCYDCCDINTVSRETYLKSISWFDDDFKLEGAL